MTTKFLIRNRAKQKMDKIPVYIRVRDGSIFDQWQPLPLLVKPEYWDAKLQCLKTRVLLPEDYRKDFSDQLTAIRIYVEDAYYADAKTGKVDNTWLKRTIQEYCKHGGKKEPRDKVLSLSVLFNEFLKSRDLSENRKKQYAVIYRTLCRYELFMRVDRKKRSYRLDVKKVDKKQLEDIYAFIKNEHLYYEMYKEEIYDKIPDKKNPPHPRGHNTMCDLMKKIRAFFNWCCEVGYISESPFKGFHIEPEIYGTPTYLLKCEVHQLDTFDFFAIPGISEDKARFLSTQRDIIVFQCNIGPRVSDLLRFGSTNVINGAIEYIPGKTRKSSGRTVVVPMNETARRIYERYQTSSGNTLLPFLRAQEYNDAMKEVLRLAGITRAVTVLNPLTLKEEQKRICDIAASHLCRRTFCANLYKDVRDSSIVGALSGHVEGSRAFSRYREIDREIKTDVVKLLDQYKYHECTYYYTSHHCCNKPWCYYRLFSSYQHFEFISVHR